jgi:carboxymethylenebutenolidase
MTTRVSYPGNGGAAVAGELELPSGEDKRGAVVLVQEWWGVNDHVRDLARRLAREGFVVLAPDLYHGVVAKDAAQAGALMGKLDKAQAVREIASAVRFVSTQDRANGKVAVMGFCMGGMLTFRAAVEVVGLAAVVGFYGLPDVDTTDWSKVTAPVLAHFASRDTWAPVAAAEVVRDRIRKAGGSMDLDVYEADHAFMNDTRPEVYSAENAGLAWHRSVTFLHKHLG